MITILIRTIADVILNNIMILDDHTARKSLMSGNAQLTKTYAKVYYRGGGWYAISGYSHDGRDVHEMVDLIKDLDGNGAVLKEGGYYFDKKGAICGTY